MPILGLLAGAALLAGGGSLLGGEIRNVQARSRGRFASSLLEGVDPDDTLATNRALFGGGLLDANIFTGNLFGETQSIRSEEGAERRSRRSAGTAAASLAENRRQFDINDARRNEPFDPETDPQLQRFFAQQEFETKKAEQLQALAESTSDGRGANWISLDWQDRFDIKQLESGYKDLSDVFDYVDQTTAADRAFQPGVTAQFQTTFQLTVLPMLQKMFEAGAMQEAELDLFKEIGGDPFRMSQLTDVELGRMRGIMAKVQSRYTNLNEAHFLNPRQLGPLPAALMPLPVPTALSKARSRQDTATTAARARMELTGGNDAGLSNKEIADKELQRLGLLFESVGG